MLTQYRLELRFNRISSFNRDYLSLFYGDFFPLINSFEMLCICSIHVRRSLAKYTRYVVILTFMAPIVLRRSFTMMSEDGKFKFFCAHAV